MTTAGTIGGVAYQPGDILARTNCGAGTIVWSMFLDGSDVGIDGNLRDFAILNGDPNAGWRQGSVILSFAAKEPLLNFGNIVPHDLALFQPSAIGSNTAGVFYRYFDGSDVGLTKAGEKIDGVAVIGSSLLLSTVGGAAVPPNINAADEDVMVISPSSLGTNTAGSWLAFFDGSDVVPASVDLTSLYFNPYDDTESGPFVLVGFDKPVTINGSSRTPDRITVCQPILLGSTTSCDWDFGHMGFSDPGLSGKILDGYDEGSHLWPSGLSAQVPELTTRTR
jgi:hypothetical protein